MGSIEKSLLPVCVIPLCNVLLWNRSGIPRVFDDTRMYGLADLKNKGFGTSFHVGIHRKSFEPDPFNALTPRNDAQHHLIQDSGFA